MLRAMAIRASSIRGSSPMRRRWSCTTAASCRSPKAPPGPRRSSPRSARRSAADHGEAPLRAVHCEAYLAFLRSAHRIGGRRGATGDASGYAWPVVGRRPLDLDRIDARLGAYSFDASSPIAEGTWQGAYWSAQTALSALDALLAGERAAFALCRPPGHHAGADYLGGYCYLNNAAIAAQAAIAAGTARVAILDVDYHHGNGTQDIFYARGDVLFVSIHADPRMDYPYFWGHADETGEGEGEGATLNLPLPRGTDLAAYLPALDAALERIAAFAPGSARRLLRRRHLRRRPDLLFPR